MANSTFHRIHSDSTEHVSLTGEHSAGFRRSSTALTPVTRSQAIRLSNDLQMARSHAGQVNSEHLITPPVVSSATKPAWMWLTSAFLVVGSTTAVYQPWKPSPADSAASGAHIEEARKVVDIQRPTLATTANVVLPATIRPWQTAALSARVSGYLTRWHRDLGDVVKAGDLLAEIETPELDQEVASADALAREADAAAIQATAERTEALADLKSAEAQLVRVQAELDLSKSQLARREKLVASRVITQEEFDTFSKEVDARTAVVAAAEADVARRRTNIETRGAIIDARQSTAKSRQSNADRLMELQAFKRITAPFDGVITRRTAENGMLVTAGREELFVVEDVSRVRVQINVPQSYSMQTVPGVTATISVPETSLKEVHGTITRIASAVDSASRTMLAEIELVNTSLHLQPGSYAQVTLKTQQDQSAWTIPTNTVLMRVEGPHVALANDQDKIEWRRVSLGRDLGSRVLVVDGIQGNERLVVNPGNELTSGLPVRVSRGNPQLQEVAQR